MRWTSPTSSQKPSKDEETKETAGHQRIQNSRKRRGVIDSMETGLLKDINQVLFTSSNLLPALLPPSKFCF
jgi:hypothetical protein